MVKAKIKVVVVEDSYSCPIVTKTVWLSDSYQDFINSIENSNLDRNLVRQIKLWTF